MNNIKTCRECARMIACLLMIRYLKRIVISEAGTLKNEVMNTEINGSEARLIYHEVKNP